MNFRFVLNQLALLSLVLSVVLLGIAGWSAFEYFLLDDGREAMAAKALTIAALAGGLFGGGLWAATRGAGNFGRREALLLVALSWLGGAALAGLPFCIWGWLIGVGATGSHHAFANPINAYFEAMSGLTTTGATILTEIRAVPRSLLLWRAMTHWLGGLGIVVLFVAVLPSLGVGGKRLFKIESPGPKAEGVTPHIRETARLLWLIYVGLTLAEIAALWLAGVDLFTSVCHTFATLATGGFSTYDSSIAGFDSVAVDAIIMVFMFLAGVNFALYFQCLRGRFGVLLKDTEFRVYFGSLLVASAVIVFALVEWPVMTTAGTRVEPSLGSAVRHGVFQAISIHTTTGFATADFDAWPFVAKAVLLTIMFIGGSAGSTAGGIKVVRVWIVLRVIHHEIERAFRPAVVRPLKIGNAPVETPLRTNALVYVLLAVLLALLGGAIIMLVEQGLSDGVSYATAATAAVATLFNIGPGLAAVGATETYADFANASKLVMSLLMALGRLELFAILVLFTPSFWRQY
jgi:trk system potassium uptake protein TrkH